MCMSKSGKLLLIHPVNNHMLITHLLVKKVFFSINCLQFSIWFRDVRYVIVKNIQKYLSNKSTLLLARAFRVQHFHFQNVFRAWDVPNVQKDQDRVHRVQMHDWLRRNVFLTMIAGSTKNYPFCWSERGTKLEAISNVCACCEREKRVTEKRERERLPQLLWKKERKSPVAKWKRRIFLGARKGKRKKGMFIRVWALKLTTTHVSPADTLPQKELSKAEVDLLLVR